ncbi:ROK family protein [Microbacterium halophytorum]|uniref:ROK family protein n=1 Tax=Microbacterium halophytorum TaxID=2067568 RepID=UPI001E508806|nr:ROK family protein [Microbacterium halophytorum]
MAAPPGSAADLGALRVGVDVGGTKVEAVALDASGAVVAHARQRTIAGPRGVAASIVDAVRALGVRPASVGVGVPGRVDGARVRDAVNLGLTDVELGTVLAAELGVLVELANDVNAAALGAHAARASGVPATGGPGTGRAGTGAGASGAREPAESLAYLNIGTGVAAGIVIGGRVLRGADSVAGEIGHLSIDPAGPECACGQRGCVEAFAGGASVARRWGGGAEHPVREVFDRADAGDARAAELVAGVAFGIAAGARTLALAVDPDRLVIGGGVTRIGERLRAAVLAALRDSAAGSPFLASLRLDERIEFLAPGESVGAIGAARLLA